MERIFHEKQEGYLCAQHCLNALLQEPYYNALGLADLAREMDEEERLRMAESGVDTDEYRHFIQQPSENMDDSGYFSVQVISSALKVFGLGIIPYNSTDPTAIVAKNNPSEMQAYICNYKGHWFTIRKIGHQWFNLNSILNGPELLSDTYLAIFFAQLLREGYSIFIVTGNLPPCNADEYLKKNPVKLVPSNSKSQTSEFQSTGYRLGTAEEEDQLKILNTIQALKNVQIPSPMSSSESATVKSKEHIVPIVLEGDDNFYDDEENLQKALKLSLQDNEFDEVEKPLQLRLNLDNNSEATVNDSDEDDELKRALQLSLECVTAPTTPDPDDIRCRRLAYLGIRTNNEPTLNT